MFNRKSLPPMLSWKSIIPDSIVYLIKNHLCALHLKPYHAGYFMYYYTPPQLSSKLLLGYQLLVCIYKWSAKLCGSWSAGFLEASWSGSTLFSKKDISAERSTKIRVYFKQVAMNFKTSECCLSHSLSCENLFIHIYICCLTVCLVWFFMSQSTILSHVGMGLPGLNQF